jgi:hypothetical protein
LEPCGKPVNAGAFVDVYAIKNTVAGLIGVAGTAAPGVVFGSSLLVKMPFFAVSARVRLLGRVVRNAKLGALL